MIRIACLAALAVAASIASANAQSESDFVAAFAGNWQTLDPSYSDGGACRIVLDPTRAGEAYRLEASQCGGPLAGIAAWGIFDNQLGLAQADGTVVARLGGNQERMSGETATGAPIVFERLPAQEAAITPAQPSDTGSCVFYGYTASCASASDRASPSFAEPGATARVSVLVRLNARTEARPDAEVVATIPAGTCVVVDQCTAASDGNWCRAQVTDFPGWIRQQALRQDRWPTLTYRPEC